MEQRGEHCLPIKNKEKFEATGNAHRPSVFDIGKLQHTLTDLRPLVSFIISK